MADRAHIETDKLLADMEEHLSAIYSRAQRGIKEKATAYFKQFERLDADKRKMVKAGKLTEKEYKQWRQNKMLYGKRWSNLKKQLAMEYANVNRTALAYINDRLPAIYALNYNSLKGTLEGGVKGYAFELVDAETVKNLATKDKTLLPYKYLDGERDVRWNTQKVNSAVLQGILQGESIPDLAKRLESVTEMNRTSAIRNARTTVTSAENKGRQDGFIKAQNDGIKLQREWISTFDSRTRHAHALLDGQLADVDKPFKSELGNIMYPGDPSARPENVYNCRCTLGCRILEINGSKIQDKSEHADRRTVNDWWQENAEELDIQQKMLYNEKGDKEQFDNYKSRLGKDAPKRFADFQNLKYRDSEAYSDLKAYYRYKVISPESDKCFFEANKAADLLKNENKIKAKGTVVKAEPITILGKRDHAQNQMISRSISEETAQKIINQSKFALRQQNGKVYAYYSKDGFAAIDTDGILRTVGRLDEGGKMLYEEVMKHVRNKK